MTVTENEHSPGGGLVQPLLKPEEVAERLNVTTSWVYLAARTRKLPSVRLGRNVRFREADINEFITKGGTASE